MQCDTEDKRHSLGDIMKTVIVRKTSNDVNYYRRLLADLYEQTLSSDPQFHFFFEEPAITLIIRVGTVESLDSVRAYLTDRSISYSEDEYPIAKHSPYGEDPFVVANLENFVPLFHANAVAAIKFKDSEHSIYLDRLIHTAFNPRGLFHIDEGISLVRYGIARLAVAFHSDYVKIRTIVNDILDSPTG